jgi:hypothetical protein
MTTLPIDNEREAEIARAMSDALLSNHAVVAEDMQAALVQVFDLATKKFSFTADEGASRRIMHLTSGEMVARRRLADRLNQFLLSSAEDVLQAQLTAKRSGRK